MAEEGEASDRQICELQVRGWPSESWSDWFGGMTIAAETVDEGSVITALRGTFAESGCPARHPDSALGSEPNPAIRIET
jgi:hypothetical protein